MDHVATVQFLPASDCKRRRNCWLPPSGWSWRGVFPLTRGRGQIRQRTASLETV